ncbi:MAG: hypothetical protein JNM12_08170 [Alphaproteobacteria bacterium]|nr:hypothetical protein [Alphaproteobacteria bacterium]
MIASIFSRIFLKRYRARLHGQNFRIQFDGKLENACFITTRYISAMDETQAKELAKTVVLHELAHRLNVDIEQQLNSRQNPASLVVEEIYQVKWRAGRLRIQRGFTFYECEDHKSE